MYMSYCRNEGTRMELAACLQSAEDHVNGEAEYATSDNEIEHFRRMMEDTFYWMRDMGLINDDGELDRGALEDICCAMAQAGQGEEEW